eukprot:gene35352-14871_t
MDGQRLVAIRNAISGKATKSRDDHTGCSALDKGPRGHVLARRFHDSCFGPGKFRRGAPPAVVHFLQHIAYLRATVIPWLQTSVAPGDFAPRRAGIAGAGVGEAVLRAVLSAAFGWKAGDARKPVARARVDWGAKPADGGAREAKHLRRPDGRSYVGLLREWELPRRLRWDGRMVAKDRQQVLSAGNMRLRTGAAAARLMLADGDWRAALPIDDASTLRVGETLLWKGPGPTPAPWPVIPTTLVRIDVHDPETPLLVRTDDGVERGVAIED